MSTMTPKTLADSRARWHSLNHGALAVGTLLILHRFLYGATQLARLAAPGLSAVGSRIYVDLYSRSLRGATAWHASAPVHVSWIIGLAPLDDTRTSEALKQIDAAPTRPSDRTRQRAASAR